MLSLSLSLPLNPYINPSYIHSLLTQHKSHKPLSLSLSVNMKLFSTAIFLLLLLFGTGMAPMVAEARTCESQSHNFKGLCFSETNCGNVCKTEGFHGGHCRGFRRRCFCKKHCV